MGTNPNITFKYDNNLLIDKEHLQAEIFEPVEKFRIVRPDELNAVLTLGYGAIRDQIEMMYERARVNNPNVVRPSIWTILLAAQSVPREQVLRADTEGVNITNAGDVQPAIRPYWHAIEEAGFMPEARKGNGRWLLARLPEEDA